MKKIKTKQMLKRLTAFAAAAVMAAAFTFTAEAGESIFNGFGNAITASAEAYTAEYDISAGSVTIDADGTYRIYSNDPNTSVTKTITVKKGVSANITLDNVNIYDYDACAFKIEDDSEGNVTIDLVGENTLKSGSNFAGLQKNGAYSDTLGKLTIKSTSGDGKLTAIGGEDGAGIGGGNKGKCSDITISSGTVTANGGENGAGIGGGYYGSARNITISGGTVTAAGGDHGAGIGGGSEGDGSYIEIIGGDVTATGDSKGAGIGGGSEGDGSYIEISDGTVTATGGIYGGAGIGGGSNNNSGNEGCGSNITISGGTVTAAGRGNGAGIGGGSEGDGSYIEIIGGDVTATGGSNGAGIGGGGYYGHGTNITISGGDVTATGGGAGIGSGSNSSGSNITISGGTVIATGGSDCAGIGGAKITISGGNVTATGGFKGAGIGGRGYITISGGTVTANGGDYGAGIGGGYKVDGSYIEIIGGDVTAIGGENGAGIGGGSEGDASNITISGGDVIANGGENGAGIGGGSKGCGSYIEISDGTVTATGGSKGAGIGSGYYCSARNITISGGDVTANGGTGGAGIGGGCVFGGLDITISGGTVTATGSSGGAGIGGGSGGLGSNITISDGTVTATGGSSGGAGIGGGFNGSCSDITISGGSVYAKGSFLKAYNIKYYSADIGNGVYYNSSSYTYSNGLPVTPTNDGTTPVYLLEIENPTGADIKLNNIDYPKSHTYYDTTNSAFATENKIYAYFPAMSLSDPNEVTVGNTTTYWYYDTTNSQWVDATHTHSYGTAWKYDSTSHWHECSCGDKTDTDTHTEDSGTITKKPTSTAEGEMTYKCEKCGYVIRTEPISALTPSDAINAFVDRLYTIILDRHAEAGGLADWTNRLKTGTATSAEIVYGIINSPEYNNKGLSNSEAIERLYRAMLGRDSDPAGKEYWLDNLAGGLTITGIINGFSGSQEFGQICADYGIKAGNITDCEPRDRNIGLTGFVSRMYTKALGRNYDVDGLNDWTNKYLTGTATTADIAYGFIFSEEFLNKNLSDEDYVETLYKTFFNRPSDATGKADWLNRMHTQGYSREMVLNGFLEAPEFIALREGFGV